MLYRGLQDRGCGCDKGAIRVPNRHKAVVTLVVVSQRLWHRDTHVQLIRSCFLQTSLNQLDAVIHTALFSFAERIAVSMIAVSPIGNEGGRQGAFHKEGQREKLSKWMLRTPKSTQGVVP